jgi:peptidoglycan hydrolase CwlO-like protein
LSQEVQRLNNVLRSKAEEIGTLQQKNQSVNYELESSRKKIGELELRIQQATR